MKLWVFSALDKAVGAFLPPFYARSKAEAIRSFSDAVSNPESNFSKHLDDFVLYELGEFDDNSGIFSGSEPNRVLSARECISRDEAPTVTNGSGAAPSQRGFAG